MPVGALLVGLEVGTDVGLPGLGTLVGADVDADVRVPVGLALSTLVGLDVGDEVGVPVCADVGVLVGSGLGTPVGVDVGADVGVDVDADVGVRVGAAVVGQTSELRSAQTRRERSARRIGRRRMLEPSSPQLFIRLWVHSPCVAIVVDLNAAAAAKKDSPKSRANSRPGQRTHVRVAKGTACEAETNAPRQLWIWRVSQECTSYIGSAKSKVLFGGFRRA